jgi:hypothetical protein
LVVYIYNLSYWGGIDRKILVWGWPQAKTQNPIWKIKQKGPGDTAQVVECLTTSHSYKHWATEAPVYSWFSGVTIIPCVQAFPTLPPNPSGKIFNETFFFFVFSFLVLRSNPGSLSCQASALLLSYISAPGKILVRTTLLSWPLLTESTCSREDTRPIRALPWNFQIGIESQWKDVKP